MNVRLYFLIFISCGLLSTVFGEETCIYPDYPGGFKKEGINLSKILKNKKQLEVGSQAEMDLISGAEACKAQMEMDEKF
jgi:hypothetical protein